MTFRTVLNKIFSGNGVVLPLPGDLARDDQQGPISDQPRTSQSEIINLFAEELRGREPIHSATDDKDEDRRVKTN